MQNTSRLAEDRHIWYCTLGQGLRRSIEPGICLDSGRFDQLLRVVPLRSANAVVRRISIDVGCRHVIVLAWAGHELVFFLLVKIIKSVGNRLLGTSLANLFTQSTIGARPRALLMLRSSLIWPICLSNGKGGRRLHEVNCLAVGCRAGLHALLSGAAKHRSLAGADFELWTCLVLAILALLNIIITGARDIFLNSLVDSVCLFMNVHRKSFGDRGAECVAAHSRVAHIMLKAWTLRCAQLPAVCSLLDLSDIWFILAWTSLESLRFLECQILAL